MKRALIVIDVQQEYFQGALAIQYPPRQQSLSQIISNMKFAKSKGIPVAFIRHDNPENAAAFAKGSHAWQLHPEISALMDDTTPVIGKTLASMFDKTELVSWLQQHDIDTLTLVGYMTNNCILASAEGGVAAGYAVEVLRDATGAIHLHNEAGSINAETVHNTLMTLLHSNFAAVATSAAWQQAVEQGLPLPKSNLLATATAGFSTFSS